MKNLLPLALLLFSFLLPRASAAKTIVQSIPLTPDQIEELVSPIALYPDPLVALILPASTFPSDVVLAARYIERGRSIDAASAEPWDDSVQALARYPEVIDYLDDHLEWTRRLGHCFMDQPDAVMDAIQMVRIRAKAAGLLTDTPQQRVVVEADEVCIVPAEPTILYIPRYDPWVICGPTIPVYRGPFITFGVGCRVGTWLNFDCDWRARSVRIVNRPSHWYSAPRWYDRDRFRQYTVTNWTRRTPYPRHDSRFDRSPRMAGYQIPGRDHRDWSDRNRSEGRNDFDRRSDHRNFNGSQNDHSSDWQNRRRTETNYRSRPAVDPVTTPVIPPVATPMPAAPVPTPSYSRPENRPGGHNRYNAPDRLRNEYRDRSPTTVRTAPSQPQTYSAPATVNRPRPVERPPSAPVRRSEPPDRTETRTSRDSDDSRSSARGNNRDSGRVYQLR